MAATLWEKGGGGGEKINCDLNVVILDIFARKFQFFSSDLLHNQVIMHSAIRKGISFQKMLSSFEKTSLPPPPPHAFSIPFCGLTVAAINSGKNDGMKKANMLLLLLLHRQMLLVLSKQKID